MVVVMMVVVVVVFVIVRKKGFGKQTRLGNDGRETAGRDLKIKSLDPSRDKLFVETIIIIIAIKLSIVKRKK